MGWTALRDLIAVEITSGERLPGDSLPTQACLARDHSLSRHEVRRALRALQDKDLVRTVQGRRCFVAQSRIRLSLTDRLSLRQAAAAQGHEVTTQTGAIWRGRPRRNPAALLDEELAGEMVVCERMAYLNGQVLQSVLHLFHPGRMTIDDGCLLADTGLSEILSAGGVGQFSRTRFRLTVREATASERVDLKIAPSQSVIDMQIVWGDGDNRPVAATHAVTPADRLVLDF